MKVWFRSVSFLNRFFSEVPAVNLPGCMGKQTPKMDSNFLLNNFSLVIFSADDWDVESSETHSIWVHHSQVIGSLGLLRFMKTNSLHFVW